MRMFWLAMFEVELAKDLVQSVRTSANQQTALADFGITSLAPPSLLPYTLVLDERKMACGSGLRCSSKTSFILHSPGLLPCQSFEPRPSQSSSAGCLPSCVPSSDRFAAATHLPHSAEFPPCISRSKLHLLPKAALSTAQPPKLWWDPSKVQLEVVHAHCARQRPP